MKLTLKILMVASLALFIFSAAYAEAPAPEAYYTKVNIWYEDPGKILATNYHRGAIIPFGTKVTIINQAKTKIHFTCQDQEGITFILTNVPKHSLVNITELLKQYFTQDDPKAKNSEFDKFNAQEKDNIENGTLIEGMSKEASIAAYGYPPKHKTPGLTSNLWTYWDARYIKKQVTFKNNLITKIEEIKEDFEGRPRWHYYVP